MLTMHKMHHPKADIDWLYGKRRERIGASRSGI